MSLTVKQLESLKPKNKRYTVTDGYGLTLRVYSSGSKVWYYRSTSFGRVLDTKLGNYPEMSLMEARQKTRQLRKEGGLEPPNGYTLNDAFNLWCKLKKGKIVSYKEEKRLIERYILKPLGTKQLDEITSPLVIQAVRHLEREGKQVTLKRTVMRLREMLDISVCAGLIQANPLAQLSKIFTPPKVTPMPSIDWRDLTEAMKVMAGAPEKTRRFFLFSLCSMLRPGENAFIEKSWIVDGAIYIPAEKMKRRKSFRVPISSLMQELIVKESLGTKFPGSKYLFAGRTKDNHINKQSLSKYLHTTSLKGKLVAHGFRSMARSWLADREVSFDVAEMCLAHDVGSAASRAYQRSDFFESRKKIMEEWGEYVRACAKSANFEF